MRFQVTLVLAISFFGFTCLHEIVDAASTPLKTPQPKADQQDHDAIHDIELLLQNSTFPNVTETNTTTTSTTLTPTKAPTKPVGPELPEKGAAEQEHHSSMTIFFILLVVAICIMVTHGLIQTKFHYLPESIAVVLIGALIGVGIKILKIGNWQNEEAFPPTVFFIVLLPPIIFESGYNLHKGNFFQNIGSILLFAIFGTVISALIVGGGLYLLGKAGLVYEFDIVESFAFGSLISAVDPVATLAIFKALNVDQILYMLVFGESVLNDAVAIVLTTTILEYNKPDVVITSGASAFFGAVGRFCVMFFASSAIGVLLGLISALLLKHFDLRKTPSLEFGLMLTFSYLPYGLAEGLHLSAHTRPQRGEERIAQNLEERISLFRPSRSRFTATTSSRQKNKKPRTWTCEFVCLSNRDAIKTPTGEEKVVLKRAGLGNKKIQFCLDDSEELFTKKLFSEEGFNKLRDCGGFELLRCQSNCRLLEIISSKYTPESLRSIIGGQSKIYIRPIQANLSMSASPVAQIANTSEIKEKCRFCEKDILITDLRDHLKDCDDNVQTVQSTEPFAETQSTSSFSLPTEFDSVDNSDEDLPDLHLARNNNETTTEMTGQTEDLLKRTINSCIDFCTKHKVTDPVDILRHIQEKIVCGRDLDLSDDATTNDGETNFILVDRDTLLQSAFEEIPALTDLRLTLQVQFYEEGAVDLGGPRKEFFAILMRDIKQKYFDPIKEWSKDYEVIGKIFALSILQNGPLPRIMTTDLIEELFETEEPRQFVKDLRKGLDSLGFYQLVRSLPSLIHLFTPIQPTPITFKKITTLLKPEFAAEGSNRIKAEKKVYSKFLKYLREAASGRRGDVNLAKVLKFATSVEEEPILGFTLHPSLHFSERKSHLPTGNTCINRLMLTVPENGGKLPEEDVLFNFFDYAFCNAYYGLQ